MAAAAPARINLNQPRYDQSTFEGRAKHFLITTNPLNCLASEAELLEAKRIVDAYRNGQDLNELGITEDKLWEMKQLYDSAFHPQTGEMLILPGRMSCQVPNSQRYQYNLLTPSGAWEYGHHRMHDDILQDSPCRCLLAICEPNIQRCGELLESQW
jgi:hypothetical protein